MEGATIGAQGRNWLSYDCMSETPPQTPSANASFVSLGDYEEPVTGAAVSYLLPPVLQLAGAISPGMRVLDVGCGIGGLASEFAKRGCRVVGIDLNEQYLATARKAYQNIRFLRAAADERVLEVIQEQPFDLVTCTEVVEHVYSAQSLLSGCFHATRPGGRLIISAPYHGYAKNFVIALLGQCDGHYNPLWEGGHIKFFSVLTMGQLLQQTGYRDIRFAGAGRFPFLWKSLVMSGVRPA
jgi:SAM-dependent methyltransferase